MKVNHLLAIYRAYDDNAEAMKTRSQFSACVANGKMPKRHRARRLEMLRIGH